MSRFHLSDFAPTPPPEKKKPAPRGAAAQGQVKPPPADSTVVPLEQPRPTATMDELRAQVKAASEGIIPQPLPLVRPGSGPYETRAAINEHTGWLRSYPIHTSMLQGWPDMTQKPPPEPPMGVVERLNKTLNPWLAVPALITGQGPWTATERYNVLQQIGQNLEDNPITRGSLNLFAKPVYHAAGRALMQNEPQDTVGRFAGRFYDELYGGQ